MIGTITAIAGGIALLAQITKEKKDENGKIKNQYVDVDTVFNALNDFKPKKTIKITEKDIENQLVAFLNKCFQDVKSQYNLEGNNGYKIDVDIAKGKVGIEIKLAKSILKTNQKQQLSGKISDYITAKYSKYSFFNCVNRNSYNLIIFVVGKKDEIKHPNLQLIREMCEKKSVVYVEKII